MSAAHHTSLGLPREIAHLELSTELRAELLNPEAWRDVLRTYARTSKLGVGLVDTEGNLLGACHNPQPVWELARKSKPDWNATCPFCLAPAVPCNAAAQVLQSGRITIAHDMAGMTHVTVPLSLGDELLGALIAGQVFDRFPDAARLQRIATKFEIPASQLWELAIRQTPMSRATLLMYGELLLAFGQAFLRQLYGSIVERKLAETNRRFRLLIDSVKEYAIYTVDANRHVTSWNSGAERMFGFAEAEMIGRESPRLFTPEEIKDGAPEKEFRTATRDGPAHVEHWQIRKDGTRFLASSTLAKLVSGNGPEFGRITRDITEQRQREEALFQAQKLESIGVLAGGIAHDFNNLLAGVLLNAGSILEDLDPDDRHRRPLEDIVAAGEAAAGLTNQLLTYSGKPLPMATTQVDFSRLVSEILHLVESLVPKGVTLETAFADDLPSIMADTSLLQQIVMNLVINAAESIGPEGGVVRIATGLAAPDVYLEVADTGCGMDEATCARIFDPFFTTKFLGRGLGLAAVSGIVRVHKGRTEIKSAVGKGTTFRIYLPASES
jgi:PAS domain S-box-containing protein